MNHILTLITFAPLLAGAVIVFLPREREDAIRTVAACGAGVALLLSIPLFFAFDRVTTEVQFVVKASWIPAYNIEYFVGIDGLSMPMVILTTLISFIAVFASFGIKKSLKGYFSLLMLLETGMLGVFISLDFFLFYVFWEVMLLPMYFLIGVWGGPRKEYAAIKFFLYTLAGSVLMLIAMLALYFNSDPHTFNLLDLASNAKSFNFEFTLFGHMFHFARLLWIFLAIGFAIKVPIFPFHTWLPDAHVEAPTAISVILAGVLLKMGAYGFLRISFPVFPDATLYYCYGLAIFGLINIIYGALCAMAQTDLKSLVAYSSISHMGYVILGMAALTPEGMNGAVFQMFNHGTITAMMFLLVGVIYDRAHHRDIDGFGGLAKHMPVYTAFAAFAFFASLGLPGLSGFISEVMVFLGAFHGAFPYSRGITVLATTGVILTAAYVLWMIQRVFLGEPNPKYDGIAEINAREIFTLAPLVIIVLALGIYPAPVLDLMNNSLTHLVEVVRPLAGG